MGGGGGKGKVPEMEPPVIEAPAPPPPPPEPTADKLERPEGQLRSGLSIKAKKKGTSALKIPRDNLNVAQPGGKGLNIPRG